MSGKPQNQFRLSKHIQFRGTFCLCTCVTGDAVLLAPALSRNRTLGSPFCQVKWHVLITA